MNQLDAITRSWAAAGASIAVGFFGSYLMLENLEQRNKWGAFALVCFMALVVLGRLTSIFQARVEGALLLLACCVAGLTAGFLIGRGAAPEFESSSRDSFANIWASGQTKFGVLLIVAVGVALVAMTKWSLTVPLQTITPPVASTPTSPPAPPPPAAITVDQPVAMETKEKELT